MSLSSIDEYSDTHHPLYVLCRGWKKYSYDDFLRLNGRIIICVIRLGWFTMSRSTSSAVVSFSPSECNFRYDFLCHLAAPSGWETWTVCLLFSTELLFYFSMKTNCVFAVQRWTGARVSAKKQPNGIKVNECKHTHSSLGSKKRLFQSQKLSELES